MDNLSNKTRFFRKLFFSYFYIVILTISSGFTRISDQQRQPTICYSESHIAEDGDTIIKYIDRQTMSKEDAIGLKKLFLKKEYSNVLKNGKKITFYYQAGTQDNPVLNMVTIELTKKKILEVLKKDRVFIAKSAPQFTKSLTKTTINIKDKNFSTTLLSSGIPDEDHTIFYSFNEKMNLKTFSKKKGKLSLVLEKYTNDSRSVIEYGEVLYASLEHGGRVVDLYRYYCPYDKVDKFYYSNGQSGYYSELIKPIADAKVNSKFGYRKHPVSGKIKMHNGVDLGAPRGTRIHAASSGVVEFAGPKGGYGNYIVIQHDKKIKTEYAHLLKFAPGVFAGSRIAKGQLIGYVGATGRATGAHLHYGVLLNNKYVDPLSFKISNKSILTKNHYKSFIAYKDMVNSLSRKLDKKLEMAVGDLYQMRNIN